MRVFRIADDNQSVALDVELPAGYLKGLVSDNAGDTPIAGATVDVTFVDSKIGASVSVPTESDGSFHVDGIPQGRSEVAVSATGYATINLKDVVVDENSPDLDIKLEKSASLHGHVSSALGVPTPNVLVARDCCTSIGEPASEVETSEDGGFEFDDVSSGPHTLTAISCDGSLASVSVGGLDDPADLIVPSSTQPITIQAD